MNPDEIVETSDAEEREAIEADSNSEYWRKFIIRPSGITSTPGASTSSHPCRSVPVPHDHRRSVSPAYGVIDVELHEDDVVQTRDDMFVSGQIAGPSTSRTPPREKHAPSSLPTTSPAPSDVLRDIDAISSLESPLSSPPQLSGNRTPSPAPADTARRTLIPDHPVIPPESVEKSRYSLRTRNAKQLNPYVYDQLLYKRQMRAIPDAIVKVVSPIKHSSHVDRAAQEMLEQLPDSPLSRPKKRKSISHAPAGSDHSELSDSQCSISSVEHQPRRKRPSYRVPKVPRPFPFRDHDLARSESPPAVVSPPSPTRSRDGILDYSSAGDLPPTTPISPRSISPMTQEVIFDSDNINTLPPDDDDDLNIIADNSPIRSPPAITDPPRRQSAKPTRRPSPHSSDSDSSSVLDLTRSRSTSPESEIEGLRELKKMWPAVMIKKYLEKAGDGPARRKRLERRDHRKQDGPIHPGETRVRESTNAARHPFAFKGDTDSSSDTDASSSSHVQDRPRNLSSSPPQHHILPEPTYVYSDSDPEIVLDNEDDDVGDSAESAEEYDYFTLMHTRIGGKRNRNRKSNPSGRRRKASRADHGLTRNTKTQRRVQKQGNLHVFATSGRRIASGRRKNVMLTVDLEDEGLQEALAPASTEMKQPRITAYLPLQTPTVRLSKARPKPVLDPIAPRVRRTVEIIPDSGIPFLQSGITFPADTYLARGWLHELVSVLSPGSEITPPAAFSAHGLALFPDMSLPEFLEAFKLVCEGLLKLLTSSTTDQQIDHAMHGVCQLSSWLPRSLSVEGLAQLQVTVDDQLSQLLAKASGDGQPTEAEITVHWFAVEISARLRNAVQRRDGFVISSENPLLEHITGLVTRLLDNMEATTRYIQELARHKAHPTPISHSAESWICLLHLLETCHVAPPESRTHPLWWVLQTCLDVDGLLAQPGVQASEALWSTIFSLCALSQFSRHGMSTSQCRIGPSWQMIVFSLNKIRLTDEPTGKTTVSERSLRQRDDYVRVVASRCLILVDRWHWNLDHAMDMFNGLADIFRSRSFANLRGEPSDFLSFIVEEDLELLFSHSSGDSAFELFLKLIVRSSHRSLEDLHIRKPLPGKSKKLLSLAVPVGSIFAKTSVMPTNHELSMLYNRFSAVAVAIHLDPIPVNANQRLAQARRYAEFNEARSNVRCVCIRAAMYFAILLHQCRLPLEPAFEWFGDMTLVIENEYVRSCTADHAGNEQTPKAKGSESLSCMRFLLDSIRHVVESCNSPQTWVIETLVPAVLNGPWITRIFSLSSAFINANSVQSRVQQLFRAILDEWERAETIDGETLLSDVLCKNVNDLICPTMYRIVCKFTNEHTFAPLSHGLSDKSDINQWIDCWVRFANILVQQEKQDWSQFLQFGAQSWEKIIDTPWRHWVGLHFMRRVLKLDPGAYQQHQQVFWRVFMESLATPKVSVEHDYMFLLFSAGGLQHPLLADLPLVAIPTDDCGMSVTNFLACRVTVITTMLTSLEKNLIKVQELHTTQLGLKSLIQESERLIFSLFSFMEMTAKDCGEGDGYLSFCSHISRVLLSLPHVVSQSSMSRWVAWAMTKK